MIIVSIDGACRRNGKPDCVSAGGVFIQQLDEMNNLRATATRSDFERESTNQRGELLALLTALDHIYSAKLPAFVVTDSEYIFNTITKEWLQGWSRKGWVTASGDPVKNRDIWEAILHVYNKCSDINFYHIKGHVISFGAVTAKNLVDRDPTCTLLLNEVYKKYDEALQIKAKAEKIEAANELFNRNHGYKLDAPMLRRFVAANIVADIVATVCVDAADANV